MTTQSSVMKHWDGEVVSRLQSSWGIPLLRVFARITSTNDEALREAEAGAPVGTTIIAEEQTHGRGRNGRRWLSQTGKSLLLSVVLPRSEAEKSSLQEEVAIATAMALQHFIGRESVLKVPNDVLSRRRRKVAGVLVERASSGHYVAGIGINIRQDASDWPIELRDSAESLRTLGVTVRRRVLASVLMDELRPLITGLPISGASIRMRRSGSRTAVIRDGAIAVRIDGGDHSGIWVRSLGRDSTTAAQEEITLTE